MASGRTTPTQAIVRSPSLFIGTWNKGLEQGQTTEETEFKRYMDRV